MNALEIADQLDWVCKKHIVAIGDCDFKEAAAMLRQQNAQIEALQKTIDSLFGGLESSIELNKAQALRDGK